MYATLHIFARMHNKHTCQYETIYILMHERLACKVTWETRRMTLDNFIVGLI